MCSPPAKATISKAFFVAFSLEIGPDPVLIEQSVEQSSEFTVLPTVLLFFDFPNANAN